MLAICVSVFLVVLMFSATKVAATTYTVGVKAGDWVGYGDFSLEWASNVPGQEEPSSDMNMSWMSMEIVDVSDSNITGRSTILFGNGTEETYESSGNIATGEGNLSVGIIPSNLSAGDKIPANLTWYTEEPLELSVNGTVTRRYAGANREVNYANITYPIIYGNTTYGAWNMSFHWDRKTGIMCEEEVSYAMSYMQNMTQYYYNMSYHWRMTATNIWPAVFTAQDGYTFNVTIRSNSTVSVFNFNESLNQISFNVTGPTGKSGYCNVTISDDLIWGDFSVYKDGSPLARDVDYTQSHNGTHYIFCIRYVHSSHFIEIRGTDAIPEFPSLIVLPLFMLATLLVAITHRKKQQT